MDVVIELLNHFRGRIIAFEGSIGVGKSTLGRTIAAAAAAAGIECYFLAEPVPRHMLPLYLKDMDRYAFCFQFVMLRERTMILERAVKLSTPQNIVLLDRSLIGDAAFAAMQHIAGHIGEEEYAVWQATHKDSWELLNAYNIGDRFITLALDCTPEEAFRRMQRRGNSAEVTEYTLDYFRQLSTSYQEALSQQSAPVVHLDWAGDRICKAGILADSELPIVLRCIVDVLEPVNGTQ